MAAKFMKATITFTRPFTLPGVTGVLPPGAYPIEWQQKFLDGMPLPESAGTPILLRLKPDGVGPTGAQTATVTWGDLRQALKRDREPVEPAPKMALERLMDDPLVRLVMSSDGVSDRELRCTMRAARMGRRGGVALGGAPRPSPMARLGATGPIGAS